MHDLKNKNYQKVLDKHYGYLRKNMLSVSDFQPRLKFSELYLLFIIFNTRFLFNIKNIEKNN